MDNAMSASDVALLSDRRGDWDGMSFMWIFALLILANGGFGFGNNGFNNAIGYENLATSNEVQRGFDNQNSMANQRDILAAVNNGTAQAVAASNQTFHDMLGIVQNRYDELARDIAAIAVAQAQGIANQNECCCSIKMLVEQTASQQRYDSAMQANAIQQAIHAEGEATRAMIQQDRYDDLLQKYNTLDQRLNTQELRNDINMATANVVRYPSGYVYNAGPSPFCNGGYGNI